MARVEMSDPPRILFIMKASGNRSSSSRVAVRTALPLFAHAMSHDAANASPAGPSPGYVSTGLAGVDAALGGGLERGGITAVAGRPGSGTGRLLISLALGAIERGDPVAFMTEHQTERQLRGRLVLLAARVNGYRFNAGLITNEDRLALAQARERMPWGVLSLCALAEVTPLDVQDQLFSFRPRLLIADFRPTPPDPSSDASRFAALAAGTEHLARLSAEYGVATVLHVPLSRGEGVPGLQDLPGQGALAEAVRAVLVLHRREQPLPLEGGEGDGQHALAEAVVLRRGGHDSPPAHVGLHLDQRFGGVQEA
jgi:hypothetical protein